MTFRRAVIFLFFGTMFVAVVASLAALYFRGPIVFTELDVLAAAKVLAFSYQLSAFLMALILFPLYWCRVVVALLQVVPQVEADTWENMPLIIRLNKLNAVFFPAALTVAGQKRRDDFLIALKGMLAAPLLIGSIFAFELLGPDFSIT